MGIDFNSDFHPIAARQSEANNNKQRNQGADSVN